MERGTDNEFDAIITDAEGRAFDIDPDTIRLSIVDAAGDPVLTVDNNPGSHVDGPNGRTRFEVDATTTGAATAGVITAWQYEIRRLAFGGAERVHIQGRLTIRPGLS